MLRYMLAALLVLALVVAGCPKSQQSGTGGGNETAAAPETTLPEEVAQDEASTPVDRGRAIYFGTDYSSTGLTCAHCHAVSPDDEQGRIFIAHSGYGAARRGAWKITTQAQLDAGQGFAKTVVDAANVCVKAPYMDHGDKLIEGSDADALTAFLDSIAQDDKPFIIARAKELPPPGLTPNMANGERIFEQSCSHCHDAGIEGLPDLDDAHTWLNPVQIMAKVRKLTPRWYEDYKNMDYANMEQMPGGDDEVVNPCNPCGTGVDEDEEHKGGESGEAEEGGDEERVFKENAMPYYGTDILSDQDVVDVAFYLIEGLGKEKEDGDEAPVPSAVH
jgi:cytochrome c5